MQVLEDVQGIGGDRLDPSTPGQRVQPGLADHIEIRADVHRCILAAETHTHKN